MARCASRTDSGVHRMRLVNSLGRMSFLPAPLPSPRNCADNGTNVAAKARVKSCAPCLSTRLMILASKKLSVFGDVMNRVFQSLRKAFPRLKKIFNRTNCPYPNSRALPERVLLSRCSQCAVAAFRSSRTSGYEEGMVARTASDAASVRRQGARFFDRRRPPQTIPALPRKLNREPETLVVSERARTCYSRTVDDVSSL
jgi:hypothetical protein